MSKIDTSGWEEFNLIDLFDIMGSTTTPKNSLDLDDGGDYPYITTAATNNGIAGYGDTFTEQGNILTVDSAVLGTVFYQPLNFTASDHVEKLIPKFEMNEWIGHFLETALNASGRVLGYAYNNKRSQTALKTEKVLLPSTPSGIPDWDYMENYMKKVFRESESRLENLRAADEKKKRIETEKWKEFRVGDLFTQERGKEKAPKQNVDGNCPMVQETNVNNGLSRSVVPTKVFKGNAITISINYASNVFYQENNFCASVNIAIIRNPHLNKYVGYFIAGILSAVHREHFDYQSKISKNLINEETIPLPVTSSGEPDWIYMEEYMKEVMRKAGDKIDMLKEVRNV